MAQQQPRESANQQQNAAGGSQLFARRPKVVTKTILGADGANHQIQGGGDLRQSIAIVSASSGERGVFRMIDEHPDPSDGGQVQWVVNSLEDSRSLMRDIKDRETAFADVLRNYDQKALDLIRAGETKDDERTRIIKEAKKKIKSDYGSYVSKRAMPMHMLTEASVKKLQERSNIARKTALLNLLSDDGKEAEGKIKTLLEPLKRSDGTGYIPIVGWTGLDRRAVQSAAMRYCLEPEIADYAKQHRPSNAFGENVRKKLDEARTIFESLSKVTNSEAQQQCITEWKEPDEWTMKLDEDSLKLLQDEGEEKKVKTESKAAGGVGKVQRAIY